MSDVPDGRRAGSVEFELRHLRALVALTEEATFTDAAIRLGITQSAVSRAIASFEQELGVQLVERTTRSVRLTDAGRRCYRAAVSALAAIEDVPAAAHDRARPLRLGYAWSALGRHTTAVLRRWREQYPHVPLEVHRVDEWDGGLGRGLADVAVVRGRVDDAGLVSELLFSEPRMAALATTHPLAGRELIRLADLRDETVLITAYGTTTLDLWPAADRPRAALQVDNTDEWLTEIAGGLAIGVTAESTAAQHAHPGVSFVPVADAGTIPVHLAWRAGYAHPSVGDFVEVVTEVVAAAQRTSM